MTSKYDRKIGYDPRLINIAFLLVVHSIFFEWFPENKLVQSEYCGKNILENNNHDNSQKFVESIFVSQTLFLFVTNILMSISLLKNFPLVRVSIYIN